MTSDQTPQQPYTIESFALEVEQMVASGKYDGYIECTSILIEKMDCEPEEVKHLLSPTLIMKIEAEASKSGLLKERHRTSDLTTFLTA